MKSATVVCVGDKKLAIVFPEDDYKIFEAITDHAVERIQSRNPPEWNWPIFKRTCNKDLDLVLAQLRCQGHNISMGDLFEAFHEWHGMVLDYMTPEARDTMGLQNLSPPTTTTL